MTALCALIIVVSLFSARSVIFGHLPLIGQYLPLPSPPSLVARFLGGQSSLGLGTVAPSSPALALLGLLGFVAIGAMGVTLKVVLIVCVALGGFGVARALRPVASAPGRLAGGCAYLLLPLWQNDVATGDLAALVAFAAAPYILERTLRAARSPERSDEGRTPFLARIEAREVVAFAAVLALAGCFAPAAVVVAPALAAATALGCVALGSWRAGIRSFVVTVLAVAGAFVLTFPWSLSFVSRGVSLSAIFGPETDPTRAPQLGSVIHLELGPFGAGALGLCLFVAALFALVVARGERYRVAALVWAQLIAAAVIAWSASEGWLGSGGGSTRVLVAPMACGVALAVGLGVAVVVDEVIGEHFGWRHLASAGFVLIAAAGALPMLGASASGRLQTPASGDEAVLDWIQPPAHRGATQRLLFLGDPAAIPGQATSLVSYLAAEVSQPTLPTGGQLFGGGNVAAIGPIRQAVLAAESGETVRLGRSLATWGVRYLVVPTSTAPLLSGSASASEAPPPELLLDALTDQQDLHELPSEGGILVFENIAWRPLRLSAPGGISSALRVLCVALEIALVTALVARALSGRRRRKKERAAVRARKRPEAVEVEQIGPVTASASLGEL